MSPPNQTLDDRADRALIEACVEGSRDAWARLVAVHTMAVRYAARRALESRCGRADPVVVEDLEAQVFLSLVVDDFRRLRSFRGGSSLSTWLRVLATNAAIDHLRRERATVPVGPGEAFDLACDDDPEAHLRREELHRQMRVLWDTLSAEDAAFAELYFVRELPFEAIAAQMHATVPALYTRKNRIRKKLIAAAAALGWLDLSDVGT